MDTPGKLVDRLMSDIDAVADGIQEYVRRPGADFTGTVTEVTLQPLFHT